MSTPSEQVSDRPARHRGALECKSLIAAANKDLFRKNAFRITGLPVDATPREASRHVDELKMQVELGKIPHRQGTAYPLNPPPSLDDIREAIQKIRDPEQRLIDEFFWFWPGDFGDSKSDPALQALAKGDTKTANEIWQARINDESYGIVAKHNLAVAYLMVSVELEYLAIAHTVSEDRLQKITDSWKSAIRKWSRIAEDDELWEKVADRIRQLNEANLPTGFARRMRASFPEAFHNINVELIFDLAKSRHVELAKQHLQYLREHSHRPDELGQSAGHVLLPTKNRLQEQIRVAVNRGEKNPRDAANAARELLKQSHATLELFDIFYGENSDERHELYDEVATICNRLPIAYQKATDDNQTCLEILRLVLPFVTSTELRRQIEENIQILNKNIEARKREEVFKGLRPIESAPELRTINGIGVTLYGSSDHDPITGSYMTTYYFVILMIPIFPICRYRVIRNGDSYRFFGKAPLRTCEKWHIAIVIGLIIWVIYICNSGAAGSSSSYTPPPAPAIQVYTPPAASPSTPAYTPPPVASGGNEYSGNNTYRVPSYASSQLDREKTAIEADREVLKQLDDQLDSLGRQIELERTYLDKTSQYAVDTFNAKVDRYNELSRQDKAATAAFNVRVDNYNAKLKTYSR